MAKPASFRAKSTIEWKVKNIFSACSQTSENFGFKGSLWRIVLYKITLDGTEGIKIILEETFRENIPNDFTSRVFIVDKNHTPQFLTEKLCRCTKGYINSCIWWTDVKDLRIREDILSTDGVVSFVCILMPKTTAEDKDREENPVQTSINAKAERSMDTLILDFRRLLDDSALSDVTLKCGDRTIPAHRNILSARSEVFAAMLRNDMSESRSGVIEFADMDPPILDQLLQFIYSCKLPDMSMNTIPQLYEAADKYGVESLKKECSAFMTENLSEGNACSILLLADSHSDCDLKDHVVSFILKTRLFQKDDIWLTFCEDHSKLAIEVLNRVCKTFSCFV